MTTSPRHRRLTTAALATAVVGTLALTTAGTAGAAELPSSSEVQSQVNGAVEDSVEYGGYVAGSVGAFFRCPSTRPSTAVRLPGHSRCASFSPPLTATA